MSCDLSELSLSQNNRVQGFKDSHLARVIEDNSSCIKCKYRDCPLSAHRILVDCVKAKSCSKFGSNCILEPVASASVGGH